MALKLARLEVAGFKSFTDPVSVAFSPGITAIVGPNGCGKSNLAEAITWVLGEQSAKSLRSSSMEDVIFNGSERRRPLGLAEVELTLTTDEHPAAEEGRLVIGRRVFRSGESHYRVNEKRVRLTDVRDLLMDTGLGIRAYSVIEQGRIGLVLSGKPQERRKLLEEAAGITRYRSRRRVATMRLEEASANLLRLDDVIGEVERSLRSLRRQARAAERYAAAADEAKQLALLVLSGRLSALRRRLAEVDGRLLLQTSARDAAQTELGEQLESERSLRRSVEERTRELEAQRELQSRTLATIEGRQEFLRGAERSLTEIAERLERGRSGVEKREEEVRERTHLLTSLSTREEETEAALDQAAGLVRADEEALAAADEAVRDAESRVAATRAAMVSAVRSMERMESSLGEQARQRDRVAFRVRHLEVEGEKAVRAASEAEGLLSAARQRTEELRRGLGVGAEARRQVDERLQECLAREQAAAARAESHERRLRELTQRHDLLEQLEQARDERVDALRSRLAELGLGEIPTLGDLLPPPARYSESLDLVLGELLDAAVVPAGHSLVEVAGELRTGGAPARLFQTSGSHRVAPPPEDPAVLATVESLFPEHPEIAAALPPAAVVETATDAVRLAHETPGWAFVSPEGLWARGGFVDVDGQSELPGLLARHRELRDLAESIPALEAALADARSSLEELVSERKETAQTRHRLDGELQETRRALAVAEARQEDASEGARRAASAVATIGEEAEQARKELDQLESAVEDRTSEMAVHRATRGETEAEFGRAQAAFEVARRKREELRAEGAGRRGQLELLQERIGVFVADRQRLQRELARSQHEIDRWGQEAALLEQRRIETIQRQAEAEQDLERARDERDGVEATLEASRDALGSFRLRLTAVENDVAERREALEAARARVEESRVERASVHQELLGVEAAWSQETGSPPPAALEPPAENLDALAAALDAARALLDRLGPVNLLAAQEHGEQEERLTFLREQRDDVAASVASLRATIREIDATSKDRFLATFAVVNEHFGEVFQFLFRGGEAEMRLIDEDDPLETGFEIIARPPGKKAQNLNLLSGGEKALTAIALLMALFKTKPSPFCILDEVDAPLDDANTLRFLEIIREMSRETQFLIVTHNKLTMEAAASMYGVTMEERGVSKLVAVSLDEIHPEPAALSA